VLLALSEKLNAAYDFAATFMISAEKGHGVADLRKWLADALPDGHKGIVLGHKGEAIKAVSKAAREELVEFLGRKVHLFLQVKVRPGWLEEAERYSEMGLNFKDGNA